MARSTCRGSIERPADVGTAGRRLFLTVNGRAVRDHGIVRAAEQAYRSTIPAGARPTLCLDVVVPADLVDVNVHPMKAEVRFRDRWVVERAVEHAVRHALGGSASAASVGPRAWPYPTAFAAPAPVDVEVLSPPRASRRKVCSRRSRTASPPRPIAPFAAPTIDVPPLVQLARTYLMFEGDAGVVLIDQHSAHERVLFERFMRTLEQGEAPSQRLLFPITLHLGPAEGEAFEAHQELFAKLGFEIEGFGGHTLIVSSVPMPHPALRCAALSARDARCAERRSRGRRRDASRATRGDARVQGGDQGRRRALAGRDARALHRARAPRRYPRTMCTAGSTIVQLPWDEIERRFGRR